ncbi:autophagy protein atg9 [Puccinia graminis f. sp. tritici]|uniref:Autophagy-related protein 9 n=1 Tax=Puccinia graminis f. sp. tritici TaxID=56615 RepID=A0A5B0SDC9_PUCGR|nr:autophagy protein atg9 [Puccinia graminis f. sp. tritici]
MDIEERESKEREQERERERERDPFRNFDESRSSSTITQLNLEQQSTLLEQSQSILSILTRPTTTTNNNHSDSFNQSASSSQNSQSNHPLHQIQDGGPPQSIMIDIDYQQQSNSKSKSTAQNQQTTDDQGYQTENSSSPTPSLTRHQEQEQEQSDQAHQSILHDHRPPSSLLLPPNHHHHQYPRSNLEEEEESNNQATPFRSGLLSRLKQIWNQERDQYFSNQQHRTSHQLNSFSHHNQSTTDREQQGQHDNNLQQAHQTLGAKEMALWRWVNVDDLDSFLQDVYSYYVGNGIWAIGLSRLSNLMTVGFVIGFSIFLFGCIDYSILRSSHHLHEVIVPQCVSRFSGLSLLLVLAFSGYYSWRVLKFGQEISNLWKMHEFFTELLEVSEADIQTIPWYRLVEQLSRLKDQHPATIATGESEGRRRAMGTPHMQSVLQRKLDAHDVANQIMREQNYLIALFNKDILNLRPPLPNWMVGNFLIAEKHLTTSLEWNLLFSLRGFLLDRRGQVKPEFLVSSRLDPSMALGLQRRFRLMAIINLIFGPFIVIYVLIYSFFRYFEEYHKNPASIGSRSFTRLAQWKFREYNELPHLFQERLVSSCCLSKQYIDQFPKTKTTILAKFVSFIAGSFAGVLILLSLYDPDAFLHFEITPERSVLFYIGLFGSILAISRGMIKQEYEEKIERPGDLMERIVGLTHYLPSHWYGKLHGLDVYNDFGQLFQLRIVNFLNELMSILLTPFIFWYNFDLDRCQRIIEFFREFTIHVDGIGYVCSFSVFDFNKLDLDASPGPSSNPHQPRHPSDTRHGRPAGQHQHQQHQHHQPTMASVQQNDINKMERSLLSFVAHHPNWEPSNQTASLYLSKAIGFSTVVGDSTYHPQPAHLAYQPNQQPYYPYQTGSQLGSPVRHRLVPSVGNSHYQQPRNGYLAPNGARSSLAGQNSLLGGESMSGPVSHSFLNSRPSQIGLRSRASRPASLGPSMGTHTRPVHHTSSSSSSSFSAAPLGLGSRRTAPAGKQAMMGVEAIDEEDPSLLVPNLNNNPHPPPHPPVQVHNSLPTPVNHLSALSAAVDEDDPFQQPS